MLHTFLSVLAIVGIVILCIAGIIILIAAGLLLLPFRYKIAGDINIPEIEEGDKIDPVYNAKIRIWWLFHIIYVKLDIDKSISEYKVKIFGITIMTNVEKQKSEKNKKKENKGDIESYKEIDVETVISEKLKGIKEISVESEQEKEEKNKEEISKIKEDISEKKETDKDNNKKQEKKDEAKKDNKKKKSDKEQEKSKKIKINRNSLHKVKGYIELLRDEDNKATIELVKNQIIRLLNHIKPNRIKGNVVYGTGDPSATGQILAFIAVFFGVTGQGVNVYPDFEKKYLDANGSLYGRIRVIVILLIVFKLYKDKNIKKIIQQSRRK